MSAHETLDVEPALQAVAAGRPAREVEAQRLGLTKHERRTGDDRDPLEAGAKDLAEASACLVNAQGGVVVVGVAAREGRRRSSASPTGSASTVCASGSGS